MQNEEMSEVDEDKINLIVVKKKNAWLKKKQWFVEKSKKTIKCVDLLHSSLAHEQRDVCDLVVDVKMRM